MADEIFEQEQEHLTQIHAQLQRMHDELAQKLETTHKMAAQDLKDMSEEVRADFGGADDEVMESLAAIETLNAVIDAYNQAHDFDVDRLRRTMVLLNQPYFAKVQLQMRPGRPPRDVYIGATGMTDENRRPLIVDWRSPVAETYYNQENGPTSYLVDGRERRVNLLLRRQFDITRDKLNMYFDTTVAIEDSLLLGALKRHHTEKLQAITATIQREQNEVVRHADVAALLVNGIAGSGKTSVLLQRIAYLFYQERETLRADQVYLFTPNDVFKRYIDTVLPSLGESNPQTFTWREFMAGQGLGDRNLGVDTDPDVLREMEKNIGSLELEPDDFRDVRIGDTVLIRAAQVAAAYERFPRVEMGPRRSALVKEDLHDRLDRRISQLAKSEELQESMFRIDLDEQVRIFGEPLNPSDDEEILQLATTYAEDLFSPGHDLIEEAGWLKIDRIGMRLTGKDSLNANEALYLRLLITGNGAVGARYVMVDEVQDYTESQLMTMARYFQGAHFLLLGDEHQAIREGTASWERIRSVFTEACGEVSECELLTSYRSSPEITELFTGLMSEDKRMRTASVRREGTAPTLREFDDRDEYLEALAETCRDAAGETGLTAVVCADKSRVHWLQKQLGDLVRTVGREDRLPASGIVLLDLDLAKGLEFDHVVVPDAQEEVYPQTPIARRRLYTAISRAMHKVTLFSQGKMTPLLDR